MDVGNDTDGNLVSLTNATLGGDANPANDEIVDGTVKFRT
jgi:hypothetical protein